MVLDSIDAKILEVLQENARVSISELSKKINLSLSAVSERLKKLESSGVIEQYTTILDHKAMDRDLRAMMMVSVDGSINREELRKLVNESEEILECYFIAGAWDYIMKIATKDTESLAELVKKVKSIKGVKTTETDIFLEQFKQQYSVVPTAGK